MQIVYLTDRTLSSKAQELVHFDVDSIRQVVAGQHSPEPVFWVADPQQYEDNGRILRDSTSSRLIAYSPVDKALYASDGCNSCTHRLPMDLTSLDSDQIRLFAAENNIRPELLERMAKMTVSGS